MKKSVLTKWLMYVGIMVFCTLIGGDFGMLAGLFLIFMAHNVTE